MPGRTEWIEQLLSLDAATVVVPAPAGGPGNWAGAATACFVDGVFYLAYRVRRPLAEGRGVSVVVARSLDGERFEPVAEVCREDFGAESFERPVLLCRPDGGWRLYLSCATPASKHWWIEALDAATPEQIPSGTRQVVLAGDESEAVKDPVIVLDDAGWRMWVCCHPLSEPGHEDRMVTKLATSSDGLDWELHGAVLTPTPGSWDARGARVTAVLSEGPLVALYDGRASAEQNWHETTGVAVQHNAHLVAQADGPVARSPYADGALRYATTVRLPDGSVRVYFEVARPDGGHDLVTNLWRPSSR